MLFVIEVMHELRDEQMGAWSMRVQVSSRHPRCPNLTELTPEENKHGRTHSTTVPLSEGLCLSPHPRSDDSDMMH